MVGTRTQRPITKCPECNFEGSEESLQNHVYAHGTPFVCLLDGCDARFAVIMEWLEHMVRFCQFKIPQDILCCPLCDKRYSRSDKVKPHLREHRVDDELRERIFQSRTQQLAYNHSLQNDLFATNLMEGMNWGEQGPQFAAADFGPTLVGTNAEGFIQNVADAGLDLFNGLWMMDSNASGTEPPIQPMDRNFPEAIAPSTSFANDHQHQLSGHAASSTSFINLHNPPTGTHEPASTFSTTLDNTVHPWPTQPASQTTTSTPIAPMTSRHPKESEHQHRASFDLPQASNSYKRSADEAGATHFMQSYGNTRRGSEGSANRMGKGPSTQKRRMKDKVTLLVFQGTSDFPAEPLILDREEARSSTRPSSDAPLTPIDWLNTPVPSFDPEGLHFQSLPNGENNLVNDMFSWGAFPNALGPGLESSQLMDQVLPETLGLFNIENPQAQLSELNQVDPTISFLADLRSPPSVLHGFAVPALTPVDTAGSLYSAHEPGETVTLTSLSQYSSTMLNDHGQPSGLLYPTSSSGPEMNQTTPLPPANSSSHGKRKHSPPPEATKSSRQKTRKDSLQTVLEISIRSHDPVGQNTQQPDSSPTRPIGSRPPSPPAPRSATYLDAPSPCAALSPSDTIDRTVRGSTYSPTIRDPSLSPLQRVLSLPNPDLPSGSSSSVPLVEEGRRSSGTLIPPPIWTPTDYKPH
ncbi:hypothetical protein FRC03_002273 [Tulasnella sp. 419]|nr:hypothetical protein FRC03_002273 [Tulasnella sp. 419]